MQLVESLRQVIQALPSEEEALLRSQLAQNIPQANPNTDLNQFSGVIRL